MDIRQLIEHAFQKLNFVMLYEMEQLIINTYKTYSGFWKNIFQQNGQYDMTVQKYQQNFAD